MDENGWRICQVVMWLMGLQTAILGAILGIMWNKISKIDQTLINVDKELYGIKTMLKIRGGCLLKDSEKQERAE
jgi:hypothetical protein